MSTNDPGQQAQPYPDEAAVRLLQAARMDVPEVETLLEELDEIRSRRA